MAKILCITTGLTGILNASYEVANRLQKAGHECILSSPSAVGQKVKEQGFNYLQLYPVNFDPAPKAPEFTGALKKIKRGFHKLVFLKQRRAKALESLGMKEFMLKIDSIKPDIILVDLELHEHIMTLYMSSYKLVLLSQWFSTWNRKGLPPIVSDAIPGIGFNGSKLGIKFSWMKINLTRGIVFLKKKITSVYTDRRSILQLYAKSIGFPKKFISTNYWPGPFSYDQLPVLSMTMKELEFPHDVRPNLDYVGAMVYSNRKDTSVDEMVKQKVNALIEEKNKLDKKLIYCSVSTFCKGDISFLKNVINAFNDKEQWVLIISLGGLLESSEFNNLPCNVHAFNRVDQIQVLKNADLSINHGGIHTINECIHLKVPMLVYSGKQSDQDGCAARVHYHKIGLMADKDKDRAEDINSKIELVLSNNKFQVNIEEKSKLASNNTIKSNLLNIVELNIQNRVNT